MYGIPYIYDVLPIHIQKRGFKIGLYAPSARNPIKYIVVPRRLEVPTPFNTSGVMISLMLLKTFSNNFKTHTSRHGLMSRVIADRCFRHRGYTSVSFNCNQMRRPQTMTNNKGLCVTSRCSKATSQGTLMPAISTNWAKQSEGEATAILQLSKLLRNPSKVKRGSGCTGECRQGQEYLCNIAFVLSSEHPLMYTTLLTGVKTLVVAGDRYYEDEDDDDDDDEEENVDVRERGVPVMELPLLAATPTIVIVQFAKTKARTLQSVRGSTFGHQVEYSNRAPSWSSIHPFAYQEPTACCSLCPCPSEIYCPKYP
ncbi:hypothetical protein V1478_018399 [Vespula squamosa]|uniref:Uncharacterized protein n=1 Tax=Vespula squamosa TaxID=30214 RepID=A0ABD1ZUY3_VESSQ